VARSIPEVQEAERLASQDWGVNMWAARAYARHDLVREATVAYERAVRLAPQKADIRVELAELHARIGRTEDSAREFRQVLMSQRNHQAARRGLTPMTMSSAPPPK
jgi:cytochrome c-type biogenesis protein CcmH/NrfG